MQAKFLSAAPRLALSLALLAAPASAQLEVQKLTASDSAPQAEFGRSIDVDGGRLVVGATPDVSNGTGTAYVFELVTGSWAETAKLVPSDGAPGDSFGDGLALDVDRLVIGAPRNDATWSDQGAVYVFERFAGAWNEVQKLTASDGGPGDYFGGVLALEGEMLLIGASGDDDLGLDSGSVYVFERFSGVWVETGKLHAGDGGPGAKFGKSLALDGSTAIIGAPRDSNSLGVQAGAAYLFDHSSGSWVQSTKLTASDGASGDVFGNAVALDGETALIGAFRNDDLGSSSGSAYLFEHDSSGAWLESQKLLPADGIADDWFGTSVALGGPRALIGSHKSESGAIDIGASYVFEESCGLWNQVAKIQATDGQAGDLHGSPIALTTTMAVVGARGAGMYAGAAYVYHFESILDPLLTGCPPSISTATGGSQAMTLAAGTDHAFKPYFVLGSSGGTTPGVTLDGQLLPLQVFDSYFFTTLTKPNQGPFQHTLGILNPGGTGTATIVVPPGYPSLAGTTLHHAYVVFNPDGAIGLASNAAPLELTP